MTSAAGLAKLRAVVAERLGLQLGELDDRELLALVEKRRLSHRRVYRDLESYVDSIEGDELHALGEIITVGETYFFRNAPQFAALHDVLIRRRDNHDLSILCAGSSTGEEPYSIAILLSEIEAAGQATWSHAYIEAIDLSPRAIATAQRGIYSDWSLREVDNIRRLRCFSSRQKSEKKEWAISDAIRSRVTFRVKNLNAEDVDQQPPASIMRAFDVIFCRNMLMYFTAKAARVALQRLTDVLVPNGFLFLGHAETLRALGGSSDDFDVISSHDTFFYRKRSLSEKEAAEAKEVHEGKPPKKPTPRDRTPEIRAHKTEEPRRRDVVPAPKQLDPRDKLDIDALLREERWREIVALGDDKSSSDDPIARAVALLNLGKVEDASAIAMRFKTDNPDAHLILALAAEHHGKRVDAIDHHRAAIYLDPSFAIAHLHLGRLEMRVGRREDGVRLLKQAAELLKGETDHRLALFAGGFTREGLVAQCETLLQSQSSGKGNPSS